HQTQRKIVRLGRRTGEKREVTVARRRTRTKTVDGVGDDERRAMLDVDAQLTALPLVADLAQRIADDAIEKRRALHERLDMRRDEIADGLAVAGDERVVQRDVGRRRNLFEQLRLLELGKEIGRETANAREAIQCRERVAAMFARRAHRFELAFVGPTLYARHT